MSAFSHLSLQTAIYDALTADATLAAQIIGVYDRAPQGSAFPYVTIGDSTARDWSTKTSDGTEHTFIVCAWSREGGRAQAATIMERLYQLLHNGSLTVSGHTLVLMQYTTSRIMQENDEFTYQGQMKFRALLQAN